VEGEGAALPGAAADLDQRLLHVVHGGERGAVQIGTLPGTGHDVFPGSSVTGEGRIAFRDRLQLHDLRAVRVEYWVVIVACRTLGTNLGDASVVFLRGFTPTRSMGLWVSTILTGCLLAAIVYFWKFKTVKQLGAEQPAE